VSTFAKSILPASLVCSSPSQTLLGLIDPDHGGSVLLYNIGNYLPVNIMSYHKRLQSPDFHIFIVTQESSGWLHYENYPYY